MDILLFDYTLPVRCRRCQYKKMASDPLVVKWYNETTHRTTQTTDSLDNKETSDSEHENDTISELKKEIEALSTHVSNLEKGNAVLTQENCDLSSSMNHLKSEMEKMKSVNVRGIVQYVMEFVASTNNIACDYNDINHIRDAVCCLTEKLIGDLNSVGLSVSKHGRDTKLTEERAEISERITNLAEKDMTVFKSTRYKASFKNDVYPMIPEKLTVYRFKDESGTACNTNMHEPTEKEPICNQHISDDAETK